MSIPAHAFADLFPMLSPADAEALRADIAANGLRERIVILGGEILDGRNRYKAAVAAGVVAEGLPPDGDDLWASHFRRFVPAQDGDPLAWVLSKNLHRRHLSEGQRAMLAADIARLGQGRRANCENKPANLPVYPSQPQAAEMLHVSERSVRSAAKVRDEGAPELVEKVRAGEVAVSAAADIASLPVTEQLRILRENNPREFRRAVKDHRQVAQAEKKERRQEREAELAEKIAALPQKRFGVILADPEWRFETYSAETGMDRAADNHYPTSPLPVIKSRPVADIAADDCALMLWATVPMLPQALEVMAAWGFAYKSHAIWMKDRVGTGYWFRNQHEILLLGTRGKVPAPAMGDQFKSALAHAVGEHSAKPPFAHEIAEAYWPSLPKIELNARMRRPGWDAWGLEAPEQVHAASESIRISKAEAEPILRARYDGDNGQELADELGVPINTIRSWAHRLGLSSKARDVARSAAQIAEVNARRQGEQA